MEDSHDTCKLDKSGCYFKFFDIKKLDLMTEDYILCQLCYNDLRNPDGIRDILSEDYGYTKEEIASYGNFRRPDCGCDNCFYGKTTLAEHVLQLPTWDDVRKIADIKLVDPAHLMMVSNGHGEFPDAYQLTAEGVSYIIKQLKKVNHARTYLLSCYMV